MNHLMSISYRSSCCWLHRTQSLLSTLSSEIQIPPRIERKPTDILRALERTVPHDPLRTRYIFHDDPFLIPVKKADFHYYAISYVHGKDTAKWIYKEHGDLFPKDLSVPRIKAFVPPKVYKDKSEESEETLLQAIADTNISDALNIYKLLDGDVSNSAKQSLLELLCFSNCAEDAFQMISVQRWYLRAKVLKIRTPYPLVEELYNFLKTQDPITVSKAHNAMICGFAKFREKAWCLFKDCQANDIPLSINTYNCIIDTLVEYISNNDLELENSLYSILEDINNKGIAPDVRTLNAALAVVSSISEIVTAENIAKHLLVEFKRLNITFSLATYNYAIKIFTRAGESTYNCFTDILNSVAQQNFTIQDPKDTEFFITAIDAAHYNYFDKEAGDKVLEILFTGDNLKFLKTLTTESAFFYSYLKLMVSTNTFQDFMERYQKLVPSLHIPDVRVYMEMLASIELYPLEVIEEYLPKIWSDIKMFSIVNSVVSLSAMEIMSRVASKVQPSTRAIFASAAKDTWNYIKNEMITQSQTQFSTSTVGYIALILLRNGDVENSMNVLTHTVKNLDSFMPMMSRAQVDELFELCISEQHFTQALLVIEYCIKVGFVTTEMAKTLYDNSACLDSVELEKLKALVKEDVVNSLSN
ncbi:small ribosomal subunit protein mS39 isoform X2 [Augochlora pura]